MAGAVAGPPGSRGVGNPREHSDRSAVARHRFGDQLSGDAGERQPCPKLPADIRPLGAAGPKSGARLHGDVEVTRPGVVHANISGVLVRRGRRAFASSSVRCGVTRCRSHGRRTSADIGVSLISKIQLNVSNRRSAGRHVPGFCRIKRSGCNDVGAHAEDAARQRGSDAVEGRRSPLGFKGSQFTTPARLGRHAAGVAAPPDCCRCRSAYLGVFIDSNAFEFPGPPPDLECT